MGFFELPPGFDRAELKRCYSRLLRACRPDDYPREFELLRAAYEEMRGVCRAQERSAQRLAENGAIQHESEAPLVSSLAITREGTIVSQPECVQQTAIQQLACELRHARVNWWCTDVAVLTSLVQDGDRHYSELDAEALQDLETVTGLLQYSQRRPEFFRGHSLRREIDRILIAGTRLEEPASQRDALSALAKIAEQPDGLLQALPYGTNWNHVWAPFSRAVTDLRRELHSTFGEAAPRQAELEPNQENNDSTGSVVLNPVDRLADARSASLATDADRVVSELEAETHRSLSGRMWRYARAITIGLTISATGLCLLAYGSTTSVFDWVAAVLCYLCLQVGVNSVVDTVLQPILARQCHRALWRPRLLQSIGEERATLAAIERAAQNEKRDLGGWMLTCLREDYAPEHYELAVRFSRGLEVRDYSSASTPAA